MASHRFRELVLAPRPSDGAGPELRASNAMPEVLAQWSDRKPEACQKEVPRGRSAGLAAADVGSAGAIPYRAASQAWPVSIQLPPGTAMLLPLPPHLDRKSTR